MRTYLLPQLPSVEEQFLGDLSALVNLDSLISMPPPIAGSGAQTASNPFAPSYPVPQPTTSNPFQQSKPRQPTLAELKGSSAQPGRGGEEVDGEGRKGGVGINAINCVNLSIFMAM